MFERKILVMQDDELVASMTKEVLEAANYKVIVSNSGVEVISRVALEKPDLVILDVAMTGNPAFETYQDYKALRNDENNSLMPIIILASQDNEEEKLAALEMGVDDYIIKPYNPREMISRVNNIIRRIEKNRRANPLTGLQGNIDIHKEINERINKVAEFSVLYGDIDNFKAYNDVYGFAWGDRAIKLTADIILDNVNKFGSCSDFVGHIGGEDFVIITLPKYGEDICKGIIKDFDEKIKSMYNFEDRAKGFITTENRNGKIMNYTLMSISLAIISNERRKIFNHLEVGDIAAELKKKAKAQNGSVFVKDMRTK